MKKRILFSKLSIELFEASKKSKFSKYWIFCKDLNLLLEILKFLIYGKGLFNVGRD
jgi:hypothetical protein